MPVFENTNAIGEALDVTWTIDLSPAYHQILLGDTLFDIQGTYHVDNVDSLYDWGNSPVFNTLLQNHRCNQFTDYSDIVIRL